MYQGFIFIYIPVLEQKQQASNLFFSFFQQASSLHSSVLAKSPTSHGKLLFQLVLDC